MRPHLFILGAFAVLAAGLLAEDLEQADESNKPGLALIRHERPVQVVAELYGTADAAGWTVSCSSNVSAVAGLETQRVNRADESLLAIRARALDPGNPRDRWFSVTRPLAAVARGAATHLLVECGSARFVNGAWGPLSVELFAKGRGTAVPLHPVFENRGGVICTYLLPLPAEAVGTFDRLRLFANGPQEENVLYVRRLALVSARTDSARTLAIETLTEKSRIRVYPFGTDVSFRIRGGAGEPRAEDRLVWKAVDFKGAEKARGEVPFSAAAWSDGVVVTVPGKGLGAGFFAFRVALASDGATVPVTGTRPKGFETFGLLPDLEIPELASVDSSRFGAQGTVRAYEERGLSPVYDLLGFRWVYTNARPADARPTRETVYEPKREADVKAEAAWDVFARRGYAPLVNMHGIPGWMAKLPDGVVPETLAKDPTRVGQKYPLADAAAYTDLVGKLMTTESRRRVFARPRLARNWYELHWEPDWHWGGTDEQFLEYYRCARTAMDRVDPTAVLTAANYGVIDKGNELLERLFRKGLGQYVNGLTTHLYLLRPDWPEGSGLVREVRRLRALADTYLGPDAPIINTEGGTEFKGNPARLDDLTEHAARLVRGHLIALGEGCTTTFLFYVGDYGAYSRTMVQYGMFFNEDTRGRAFGPDSIAPKPAGMAVAAMIRLLEGTKTVGRRTGLGEGVHAYEFMRGATRITALWAPAGTRRVVLPGVGPSAVLHDFMANRVALEKTEGGVAFNVGPEPCYLVVPSGGPRAAPIVVTVEK